MKRKGFRFALIFILLVSLGFCVPQNLTMPVKGASKSSYHPKSFWYYPWGRSGTHKGVDIFAKAGTPVLAATSGLVIHTGQLSMGGNIILVLGPKWRFHYYAHLQQIETGMFNWVNRGEQIGRVGTSGNAKGKPPHLHYAIVTAIPYPWRIDNSVQGNKKMFFLNPIDYLKK